METDNFIVPNILYGEYDPEYQELLNRELQDGLNFGIQVRKFNTAEITQLISAESEPVLPAGTLFFNTTLSKWQGIVTQADPDTNTDGVIETITSV